MGVKRITGWKFRTLSDLSVKAYRRWVRHYDTLMWRRNILDEIRSRFSDTENTCMAILALLSPFSPLCSVGKFEGYTLSFALRQRQLSLSLLAPTTSFGLISCTSHPITSPAFLSPSVWRQLISSPVVIVLGVTKILRAIHFLSLGLSTTTTKQTTMGKICYCPCLPLARTA